MSFENILVPYNGSQGAKRGYKSALELASKTGGKITTITCIESPSILSFLKLKKNEKEFEIEKKIIEKELSLLKKDAHKLKIPLKIVVLKSAFAANTILDYAKSNKIDTVVIGKTKFQGPGHLYHESMVKYLSMRINCPMVIVK
ncbi:MAG: universal stress protein [Nitrosopumilaceae archaeon]